jgi:hypothetical protein
MVKVKAATTTIPAKTKYPNGGVGFPVVNCHRDTTSIFLYYLACPTNWMSASNNKQACNKQASATSKPANNKSVAVAMSE